jgi:hypothetical protein
MITRNDLKIVDTYVEPSDNTVYAHVEHDGVRYILTSTNVTDDVLEDIFETDPISGLYFSLDLLPRKDNGVFYGDENWHIKGECSEECEKSGVCTKRIASDRTQEEPTIDHSFSMLLRFLND